MFNHFFSGTVFLILLQSQNIVSKGVRGGRPGSGSGNHWSVEASRYSSQAAVGSGGGSGFSSGGGFNNGKQSQFGNYRAPTATIGRIYVPGIPGAAPSSLIRPNARIPSAVRTQPTKVVYSSGFITHRERHSSSPGTGNGFYLAAFAGLFPAGQSRIMR